MNKTLITRRPIKIRLKFSKRRSYLKILYLCLKHRRARNEKIGDSLYQKFILFASKKYEFLIGTLEEAVASDRYDFNDYL
ncbi:hypothetical protein D1609_04075 [Leptospira borgpetersenii serovar Hardjo-bovis]|nr:hypothetical protein B9T54_04110 [Leptospira borgpetersenii serovar Hardjo-bovis]AYR07825.1 hypothetical protein D1609_04075 [Leptospira borgpetersenii serovar Hardjo-bovis]